MPDHKVVKLRRGTTSEHQSFFGAEGEITVDTTKNTVVVHDGSTIGGFPLKVEDETYDRVRYLTFRAAITQQGVPSLGFSAPENAPVPVAIETNGIISGAAAFSYQAGQSIQDHFMLPAEFVAPLDVEFLWRSSAIMGYATWTIETCGVPIGTTLHDATFNSVQHVNAPSGNAPYELVTSTISGLVTTNLEPEGECFFRVTRSVTDTLLADAELLSLRFVLRVRGK